MPLIIKFPRGAFSSKTVHSQVRTIDIAPTILDVVGGVPPPLFLGSSVVDVITGAGKPRIAISQARRGVFTIRTDRWKYLDGQLFDLSADPMERHDVTRFFLAVRNWLEVHRGMLSSLSRLGSAESVVPSEELLRQLRALGYVR